MTELREKCEWSRMSSDCAMNTPSIEHFRENGVHVQSCWIPYDYDNAYKVYFVSDTKGNEFGQFHDLFSALLKARNIAKYTQDERYQFDL